MRPRCAGSKDWMRSGRYWDSKSRGRSDRRARRTAFTCANGFAAKAAAAAAEIGFTTVGSKPLVARLYFSTVGVSCSQRSPTFNVRLPRTRQSS